MLDNYQNPITTQEDIKNLHKVLVQTVIDYIKKYNLTDINEVHFSVDGLDGDAIEFGEWTPCMDSTLSIVGLQDDGNPLIDMDGNEIPFRVRRIIGESMYSFLMLKNKTMVCTSIEQSNKLIELGIDTNTADMGWFKAYSLKGESYKPFVKEYKLENHKTDIPAWSLFGLIKIMPCEVTFNDEVIIINNKKQFGSHINVFDNVIDAIQYLKDNNELFFN